MFGYVNSNHHLRRTHSENDHHNCILFAFLVDDHPRTAVQLGYASSYIELGVTFHYNIVTLCWIIPMTNDFNMLKLVVGLSKL